MLGLTLNMNKAPSSEPSLKSMKIAMNSVMNSNTNSDVINATLTFSIIFAPNPIVVSVKTTTKNWKKMTWPDELRKAFHTSVVSTSPTKPPVSPSWKYLTVQPATTA